ncbi:MAG TPA: DUF1285 domain-containing protein [Alphaproteobacteria bacterium]|nr:DUF1285 domain-containing protein [Alphaproteobacteria bacterium]
MANEFGLNGAPASAAREPFCGVFDIRIAADGTWHYRGSPIGRKELVKLFASVLRRDAAGDYWLVTPVERGRIRVDDAPFTAVELTADGEGSAQRLTFRTNLDEMVVAGKDHPLRVSHDPGTGAPRPYILVRPGLEALVLRPVFYQLVELGVTLPRAGEENFGVWSAGQFFPLGKLEEEA